MAMMQPKVACEVTEEQRAAPGLVNSKVQELLDMVSKHADEDTDATCSLSPQSGSGTEEAEDLPISIFRRTTAQRQACLPTVQRRWVRVVGKLFARALGAVPLEDGRPTSIGSLVHALGKPCSRCIFASKEKGCFDGVLCSFCHFSCDHVKAPGRRGKGKGKEAGGKGKAQARGEGQGSGVFQQALVQEAWRGTRLDQPVAGA
mmetsp:Transcript_50496/g.114699  ORF Transcript_50496/g.114699 Transcript_50496/m.114699 type:complete len:203 (+) Transcript_50496:29-637(+)